MDDFTFDPVIQTLGCVPLDTFHLFKLLDEKSSSNKIVEGPGGIIGTKLPFFLSKKNFFKLKLPIVSPVTEFLLSIPISQWDQDCYEFASELSYDFMI